MDAFSDWRDIDSRRLRPAEMGGGVISRIGWIINCSTLACTNSNNFFGSWSVVGVPTR
jgi:hypothetical protein